ncbi:MAG: hypothetical protein AABY10_03755 [Nanoarchaeota archaeon]
MVFGSIADVFYQWEFLGVFDFILPFLLIFAITFGIMDSVRFFGKNKPVYIIIALVISLMSLRFQNFVSDFMTELFPRLGIGLSVMIALMVMVGLFIADDVRRYWFYGLSALGGLIGISVLYQTFNVLGWWSSGEGSQEIGMIVLGVLLLGIIIAVGASGSDHKSDQKPAGFTFWRDGQEGGKHKS